MAHQARFDPGFLSIKHLEVLLFHPGWDASSQQGYPPPPSISLGFPDYLQLPICTPRPSC